MLNVKKIASVAMAALMAVTVSATTLTTTAEAASHNGPQIRNEQQHNPGGQKNDGPRMNNHSDRHDNRGPQHVEHKSAPHHNEPHHNAPAPHYEGRHDDSDNTGNLIAAGILGLAVGAILASD